MRAAPGIVLLVIGLSLQLLAHNTYAHTELFNTLPSTRLAVSDTTNQQESISPKEKKPLDPPTKAALLSAAVPGLGQAYNKAYWKIPAIYATGSVLGYFVYDNNKRYQHFKEALAQRRENTDKYQDHPEFGVDKPNNIGTARLSANKNYYRRNRDVVIILSAVAYTMQIAEAYVHGHMREFDVSENLSLRVQPSLLQMSLDSHIKPGISLTLHTKQK